MAKGLKLKWSSVIPSLQTCRDKDPSSLPSDPVSSSLPLTPSVNSTYDVNYHGHHHHTSAASIKRQVSSAFTCGSSCRSSKLDVITAAAAAAKPRDVSVSEHDQTRSPPQVPPVPEFHWEREERWHVVAKIFDDDGAISTTTSRRKIYSSSSASDHFNNVVVGDIIVSPPTISKKKKKKKKEKEKQKRRRSNKKKQSVPYRINNSSDEVEEEEEEDSGLFTSEGETETLVISTDSLYEISTTFNSNSNRRCYKPKDYYKNKKCIARSSRGRRETKWLPLSSPPAPARLSGFRWWCGEVEGKVRESFAVVKRSEDPREDFKRSMMEMILEKEMFEERDLEQLLVCFLSLNSNRHHCVIVQAFVEICHALFATTANQL